MKLIKMKKMTSERYASWDLEIDDVLLSNKCRNECHDSMITVLTSLHAIE